MVKKLSNSVSHRRLNSHPSKQERIARSDESLRVGVQVSNQFHPFTHDVIVALSCGVLY
jgi:hypothetical protein